MGCACVPYSGSDEISQRLVDTLAAGTSHIVVSWEVPESITAGPCAAAEAPPARTNVAAHATPARRNQCKSRFSLMRFFMAASPHGRARAHISGGQSSTRSEHNDAAAPNSHHDDA